MIPARPTGHNRFVAAAAAVVVPLVQWAKQSCVFCVSASVAFGKMVFESSSISSCAWTVVPGGSVPILWTATKPSLSLIGSSRKTATFPFFCHQLPDCISELLPLFLGDRFIMAWFDAISTGTSRKDSTKSIRCWSTCWRLACFHSLTATLSNMVIRSFCFC